MTVEGAFPSMDSKGALPTMTVEGAFLSMTVEGAFLRMTVQETALRLSFRTSDCHAEPPIVIPSAARNLRSPSQGWSVSRRPGVCARTLDSSGGAPQNGNGGDGPHHIKGEGDYLHCAPSLDHGREGQRAPRTALPGVFRIVLRSKRAYPI